MFSNIWQYWLSREQWWLSHSLQAWWLWWFRWDDPRAIHCTAASRAFSVLQIFPRAGMWVYVFLYVEFEVTCDIVCYRVLVVILLYNVNACSVPSPSLLVIVVQSSWPILIFWTGNSRNETVVWSGNQELVTLNETFSHTMSYTLIYSSPTWVPGSHSATGCHQSKGDCWQNCYNSWLPYLSGSWARTKPR